MAFHSTTFCHLWTFKVIAKVLYTVKDKKYDLDLSHLLKIICMNLIWGLFSIFEKVFNKDKLIWKTWLEFETKGNFATFQKLGILSRTKLGSLTCVSKSRKKLCKKGGKKQELYVGLIQ